MNADAKESAFQQDIIDPMVAGGWKLGEPAKYDRKLALYTEDCLEYVKTTQPKTWEKYETLYPADPEQAFIDKLASQLSKADPQASDKSLRTSGTLGVLRHELRDKSASFKMCQFKPEHGLNPDTLAMYEGNILRIVPELVYSPWTKVAPTDTTLPLGESASEGRRGNTSEPGRFRKRDHVWSCQTISNRPGVVRQRHSRCDDGIEK